MLRLIKKILPIAFRKKIRKAKGITIDHIKKKRFSKKMAGYHKEALKKLQHTDKIKVVFLAIHKSVWKVDPVFKKMLNDSFFEPIVFVCPYTQYGQKKMIEELEDSYNFFSRKGYPVISGYREDDDDWTGLEELNPDLVFFTNPNDITINKYYENAYKNHLSCYVPYYYLATNHASDISTYNSYFHNAMWKIFMPHQISLNKAKKASNKGKNCVLTGYPACESLLCDRPEAPAAWKEQLTRKKKIIWAPHHSIENANAGLSNFLAYSDFFIFLSKKYESDIQWSFKPHPILKSKLYLHPDWGRKRTDEYYYYWASSRNTQLDDGEYSDLFLQSDAIIHDSSSFIVEYLFVKKPCLYLIKDESQLTLINDFGLKALDAYRLAKAEEDIELFLNSVISGTCELKNAHLQFIADEINPLYGDRLPSDRILEAIKYGIANDGGQL